MHLETLERCRFRIAGYVSQILNRDDAHIVSVSVINHLFALDDHGFVGFNSQHAAMFWSNHRIECVESHGRDVESLVLVWFSDFDHNHRVASKFYCAPNGLIRAFDSFNCKNHLFANNNGLSNVEARNLFCDALAIGNVGVFLGCRYALS